MSEVKSNQNDSLLKTPSNSLPFCFSCHGSEAPQELVPACISTCTFSLPPLLPALY